MPESRVTMSSYRSMWLFTLFDLPMTTPTARKEYTRFRKALLKDGFSMLQYSVYARHCASEELANVYKKRIKAGIPAKGEVRILMVTDRQFEKMENYFGKKRKASKPPPAQLMLL